MAAASDPGTDAALLIAAYGRLFGTLPRVGAAVVAFGGFGYFLGWQDARAYRGAFGASWVVSLLSTVELSQRAYWPLLIVCGGLLLGVVGSTIGNWSSKTIRQVQAGTGLAGGALASVPLFGDRYSPAAAALLATLSGVGLSACLGMIVAQHARALRDQGIAWGVGQLSLLTYVCPFLIVQLPLVSGVPEGRAAADARTSTLPHVAVGGEDYRLVLAHADRLVVAKLRPGAAPVLRIVASDAANAIVNTSSR